jgi:hypothetical protein
MIVFKFERCVKRWAAKATRAGGVNILTGGLMQSESSGLWFFLETGNNPEDVIRAESGYPQHFLIARLSKLIVEQSFLIAISRI